MCRPIWIRSRLSCAGPARDRQRSHNGAAATTRSQFMALSFYDLSVPVFTRALGQLSHILDKGLAHAQAAGIDPSQLVNARLAPDMFTLAGQVQSASDVSKFGAARIAGITGPSFPDDETTYAELRARVAKTIDYLGTVDRGLID